MTTASTPPARLLAARAVTACVERVTSSVEAARLGYAAVGDGVVGGSDRFSAFTLEYVGDRAQIRFYRHPPVGCSVAAFLQHRPPDSACNNVVPLVLAPGPRGVVLVDQRTAPASSWCTVRRGQSKHSCYDRVSFAFGDDDLDPMYLRVRRGQQCAFYIEKIADADEFARDATFEVLAMDNIVYQPNAMRRVLFRPSSSARHLVPINLVDIISDVVIEGGGKEMRALKDDEEEKKEEEPRRPPPPPLLIRATERDTTIQYALLALLLLATLLLASMLARASDQRRCCAPAPPAPPPL